NLYSQDLLKDALEADNLINHYNTLEASDQGTLLRLLLDYVICVLDAQLGCYTKLQDDTVKTLFSSALQKKLDKQFGTDLREVVIDNMEHPADIVTSSTAPVATSPETPPRNAPLNPPGSTI